MTAEECRDNPDVTCFENGKFYKFETWSITLDPIELTENEKTEVQKPK